MRADNRADPGFGYELFTETLKAPLAAAVHRDRRRRIRQALAETTIGLYKTEFTPKGLPFRTGPLATLAGPENHRRMDPLARPG